MRQNNRSNWSGGNRDDRRSGGRNFNNRDNRGSRNGRNSNDIEMHKTICAECNSECEVPFKPRGDKPVYCSDCFDKNKNQNSGRRNFSGRTSGSDQNKELLTSIDSKLEQILEVLKSSSQTKLAVKKDKVKKEVKKKVKKEKKVAKKTTKKVAKKK